MILRFMKSFPCGVLPPFRFRRWQAGDITFKITHRRAKHTAVWSQNHTAVMSPNSKRRQGWEKFPPGEKTFIRPEEGEKQLVIVHRMATNIARSWPRRNE
jgi:hypothetical protein